VLEDVAPTCVGRTRGSKDLLTEVLKESVVTRTGRIRTLIDDYCAAKNTPFQGLASDGAKISLYRLDRAGFRVCNFVHDENVIDQPLTSNIENKKNEIKKIMKNGMATVVPDVKISVDIYEAEWWEKR
jgi:DNA polymerase I-like protein with 3'-5' exonuclease and polymerase domains